MTGAVQGAAAARGRGPVRLLRGLCAASSALALFAIMALTFVDVLGRKLADHSLPGALELTEILMVVVIFAALPLVSWHREHVVFDSLDERLPPAVRRWQARGVNGLCALCFGGLAVLMWRKAGEVMSYGDITAQLKLPQWPFVAAMGLACALAAAVHLWWAARPEDSGA